MDDVKHLENFTFIKQTTEKRSISIVIESPKRKTFVKILVRYFPNTGTINAVEIVDGNFQSIKYDDKQFYKSIIDHYTKSKTQLKRIHKENYQTICIQQLEEKLELVKQEKIALEQEKVELEAENRSLQREVEQYRKKEANRQKEIAEQKNKGIIRKVLDRIW